MNSSRRHAVSTGVTEGGAEQIVNLSRCWFCNKPHGLLRTGNVEEGWLLEQVAKSRLCTMDQTGRRGGDGDWGGCNAPKRHCVCLSLGQAEEVRLYGS